MKKNLFTFILIFVSILFTKIMAQTTITFTKTIDLGSDDAEQAIAGGTGTVGAMDLTSSDLENTLDGTKYQTIGMRFNNISLPKNLVIDSAFIQFATKGDKAPVFGNVYLKIQAIDSAATFTSANFNISSRTFGNDSVLWAGSTSSSWGTCCAGTKSAEQKTPDLKALIQALVNRSGWKTGNALVIIVTGTTGVRNAYTFDGSSSLAPQLIVYYHAQPQLLKPNGGETWQAGATKNITWNANGLQNVKIQYTTNGTSWNNIVNSTPAANGFYSWTLPTVTGSNYRVRILDTAATTTTGDTSDATFNIANDTLLFAGSSWKYLDNGSNQGTAWRDSSFVDSSWANGNAELGYGDGDEVTIINACGTITQYPSCSNKYTTTYFRKKIFIADTSSFNGYRMEVVRDDGAIVYINGQEVWRDNIGTGTVTYTTLAPVAIGGADESAWNAFTINKNYFVQGWNTIAVEMHQQSGTSSDVSFNLRLKGNQSPNQAIIVLTPNGGQNWTAGTTQNITWNAQTNVSKVKIEYSNNGGSTWNAIASSVTASLGTYVWSVPMAISNNTTIKISDTANVNSFDTSDAKFAITPPPPAILLREPYIQMANQTAITIRWRTNVLATSRVRWGATLGNLLSTKVDSTFLLDHEVRITGLTPYTKYFYSIGSLTDTLQGDSNNFFRTMPLAKDTSKLYRIGLIGDCGNNSTNQVNVKNQLLNYLGPNYMDAWILSGDNAYTSGSDAEFQANFFNIYKNDLLKKYPMFSAPGNHDYINGSATAQNNHIMPYYDIFTCPTNGECGGLASGTEAFYSFDYGNVHFLSLDSYGKENNATRMYDTTGAQVTWIKNDLAANTNKQWVVAFWHHPPYTMGSHNSDTETELALIRQNFIQILERMGVDLIITGHSHDYERSKLMKGHYGLETSFNASTHNLSNATAKYDTSANSCPYVKDSIINTTGTVYVVSGSAGQLGGTQSAFPHNAMYFSDATNGGSMLFEVKGNRLDAKWICADGVIRDKFTMVKDVNIKRNINIINGDSVTLTASYIGNYNWTPGSATSRSIKVAPSSNGTYVVKDNFSCLSDTFNISVTLPVKLTQFTARLQNKEVRLKWTTATEENNDYFTIERSIDGVTFEPIGKVKGAGNSTTLNNYTFIDEITTINKQEEIYYRLKQTDFDGQFAYSKTVIVNLNKAENFDLKIYPNPNNGSFNLSVNNAQTESIDVMVYDVLGKKHFAQNITITNGSKNLELNLPPGFYTVTATTLEGEKVIQKIIVN